MLSYLSLKDYALIDSLSLNFSPGLNVLTGETGAGKSIIIGALSLILGERASSEHIRTGSEQALIEAVFSPPAVSYENIKLKMEELGLPFQDEVIVSREISLGGRNLCRINGRVVPLVTLKEIGSLLVDLHGQHNHQSLLHKDQHLYLLDEFGDEELIQTKALYQQLFFQWQSASKKLQTLGKNTEERKNRMDLLTYQAKEILDAGLSEEEEESLTQRLNLLDNLEKILLTVNGAYTEIYSGLEGASAIADRLSSIRDDFVSLQKADPRLAEFVNYLDEAVANLTELGRDLYHYQDNLHYHPAERTEIENRLEIYRRLKRKYQLSSIDEVISFAHQCREQIEILQANEEEASRLEKEHAELRSRAEETAARLLEIRKTTAEKLKIQVESTLKDLGISAGKFSASLQARGALTSTGADEVEFLFSANPGEDLKPLAKIISAGEMARVMLALKSILAEEDRISTLVFDEIDSGIGGKTIRQVAEKMAGLSLNHQIICVTHSPQIAGVADHQYLLFKEVKDGRTATRVKYLTGEERLLEVARMLDGMGSEITKQHAEELLNRKITPY